MYGRVFGAEALSRFVRRWDWQFHRNPAARIRPSQMWVAEASGTIVGYLASFPQRMKFLDREQVIYHDCDLIVAPTARRQGIGQRLVEAYDAFPNPLSNCLAYAAANGRIRRRVGYRPARVVPRYVRPYDLRAMGRYMASSGRLPPAFSRPPLARTVDALGGALNAVVGLLNWARRPPRTLPYVTERLTAAGPEFDRLWARTSAEFPVLTVRDRAFIQWRFFDDPVHEHIVFAARDISGELAGYIALRISSRDGIRAGRIMDCFCSPRATPVTQALVRAALRYLESEGVHFVYCLGLHPAIRKTVQRYLYITPSALDEPAWLLWKGPDELRAVVYEADSWHISHADSDIGFGP